MAFQAILYRTGLGVINMNLRIVAAGEDLVTIEQEASNHMAMVSAESEVLRRGIFLHPGFAYEIVALVERLEEMHVLQARQPHRGMRHSFGSCSSVCEWALSSSEGAAPRRHGRCRLRRGRRGLCRPTL